MRDEARANSNTLFGTQSGWRGSTRPTERVARGTLSPTVVGVYMYATHLSCAARRFSTHIETEFVALVSWGSVALGTLSPTIVQ